MRKTEFERLKKQFELEFGFKFLKETRKREYVEARAAFIYYLYKFRKVGLVEITRLFQQVEGWKPNHATIHHSLKNYEIYTKYNPKIDEVIRNVIGYFRSTTDKQLYIKNKITKLPKDFVDQIHTQVENEYKKFLEEEHAQLRS